MEKWKNGKMGLKHVETTNQIAWYVSLEHEWIMTCHILGISSSQLTNSIIFQRGGYTTNYKVGPPR